MWSKLGVEDLDVEKRHLRFACEVSRDHLRTEDAHRGKVLRTLSHSICIAKCACIFIYIYICIAKVKIHHTTLSQMGIVPTSIAYTCVSVGLRKKPHIYIYIYIYIFIYYYCDYCYIYIYIHMFYVIIMIILLLCPHNQRFKKDLLTDACIPLALSLSRSLSLYIYKERERER